MSINTTYPIFNPSLYDTKDIGPRGPAYSYVNFTPIGSSGDFPASVGDVITLEDETTYMITTTIDLQGKRIVCGNNTAIIGASSENSKLLSTGLTGAALITSNYSLPMRDIAIEANIAMNCNGTQNYALDWHSVNFVNCPTIGTVSNYSNFIMVDSSFLNSSGLSFSGSIGTIGFNGVLFNLYTGTTGLSINGTVSRRFRIIYSSMVIPSGTVGIHISTGASILDESYILDTINFSGNGTYFSGAVTGGNDSTNKALWNSCKGSGVDNTFITGQLYMSNNATATVVSATNTFYDVSGSSSSGSFNSRISSSGTTLTCQATIKRKYLVQATLSFTSGVNNVCEFGLYDSSIGNIITSSRTKSTANGSGRAENIALFGIVDFVSTNFVKLQCSNTSSITNITVSELNFVITEL